MGPSLPLVLSMVEENCKGPGRRSSRDKEEVKDGWNEDDKSMEQEHSIVPSNTGNLVCIFAQSIQRVIELGIVIWRRFLHLLDQLAMFFWSR